ncbi:Ran GTPase-activating protein 1 [Golovinomyces cichoracearum]|uniref:Ran GTPase-activating protein 1 n=1 Tax=Golovinomyces cichoracearum TaxID=62708 RepID=A0A420HDL7_9PEZI|nr:Ran GTPase-activating protein 1 [Golovinomyces cichoracearum]
MAYSHDNAKVFSLEGKGLKLDSVEDVEQHFGRLREMEHVEEVRLQGNTLGVVPCQILGEILRTKKNLLVANFADIFTGRLLTEIPKALKYLLDALLTLPKLNKVILNDNAFGLKTSGPLVDFLSSHVPLQHLILNNNGLGPESSIKVAEALILLHAKKEEARKESKHVPNLETIICGRNRLESASMMAWAKVFSLHTGVKEVKMAQNGIRSIGIYVLLNDGLRHAKGIRVLDLEDNTFLTKGASALAKVVPDWIELRELGVGDCFLESRGSLLLVKALGEGMNQNLEVLRLQYNQLNSKTLSKLALVVKTAMPNLRKMALHGNRFEGENQDVVTLRKLLSEHKDKLQSSSTTDDDWGLDPFESDESEGSEGSEESEWKDSEPEDDKLRQRVLDMARDVLGPSTFQPKDKNPVDQLTHKLEKIEI